MNRGVSLVLRTEASKLTTSRLGRPVAVTHVSQSTCPQPDEKGEGGCPWWRSGCYAELGPEGRVTRRLAASETPRSSEQSSDSVALAASLEEARQIWAAAARAILEPGNIRGVPLRLHVVGDVAGALGALVVGRACVAWKERGGGEVWSYTHRWSEIRRAVWGPAVNVLASVETIQGARSAARMGYAVALVSNVGIDAVRRATRGVGRYGGLRRGSAFACPQQQPSGAKGARADCASCMACARMGAGAVMVLRGHGPRGAPTRAMAAKLREYAGTGAGTLGEASGAAGGHVGAGMSGAGVGVGG